MDSDDEERPDEKFITRLGGTEIWYAKGLIPPPPPRAPCEKCGGPTIGPALFYAHDRTYRWWCRQCGLYPPLQKEPEPLQLGSGSNNQSARTRTTKSEQLELLSAPPRMQ